MHLLIDSVSPNELAPQGRVSRQPGAIMPVLLKEAKSENKTSEQRPPYAMDRTLTEIVFMSYWLPVGRFSFLFCFFKSF